MKVLLIADSPLIFAGLRSVILDTIHTAHFTETRSLIEASTLCSREPFQLAIVDIRNLSIPDISIIVTLKEAAPRLTIWVNLRTDFTLLRSLLKAGVQGVFSSKSSYSEFEHASRKINMGTTFVSDEIQEQMVSAVIGNSPWPVLTERQEHVADLLAAGFSRRAIAEQINVKPSTVTHYRQIIFKKLGINSMKELRQKRGVTEPMSNSVPTR
jgi:DNA-binding NarL/FixJ family response regulator